jgi:hypothetical protein
LSFNIFLRFNPTAKKDNSDPRNLFLNNKELISKIQDVLSQYDIDDLIDDI